MDSEPDLDPYEILGVTRDDTPVDICRAFGKWDPNYALHEQTQEQVSRELSIVLEFVSSFLESSIQIGHGRAKRAQYLEMMDDETVGDESDFEDKTSLRDRMNPTNKVDQRRQTGPRNIINYSNWDNKYINLPSPQSIREPLDKGTKPGRQTEVDGITALCGGVEEEDSQQFDIELPLMLAGHRVMTTPDTGSDRNVMSENKAKELGLSTEEGQSPQDFFMLANGRVISCKGKVSTHFAFPFENTLPLPIEFHILESLTPSIVIGRAFLDATRTLTTYLNRLVRTPQPCGLTPSIPRILHLSPPRRTLRCFINSTAVQANADTGAEMNLASPGFAVRSGFRIEPADPQHQFVQLADESIAPVCGCFRARFNPSEKPLPETLRPRAHMKTFYILEGLTSDVLLGRHLLFEIHAFVQQTKAFLDVDCPDLPVDLNLIAWLNRWRSRSNSEPAKHASFQEIDSTFWHGLDADDAREQRMRQQAEANASHFTTEAETTAARAAESQRQERYGQRRQKRIQEHEEQMTLLKTRGQLNAL